MEGGDTLFFTSFFTVPRFFPPTRLGNGSRNGNGLVEVFVRDFKS